MLEAVEDIPLQIKYFPVFELPEEYKKSILSGRLCYRNGEAFVQDEYINDFFTKRNNFSKGLVICLKKEEVVGVICFKTLSKKFFLLDIFCRKEGKMYDNVSTMLFNELKNIAIKNFFTSIHLFSTNEFSTRAYKKLGFVSIGEDEWNEMVYNISTEEISPVNIGPLGPIEKSQENIKKESLDQYDLSEGFVKKSGYAKKARSLQNDIKEKSIPPLLASALHYTLL